MDRKIPLSKPYVGEEELAQLKEVIESGWLGLGPKQREFEALFAKKVGTKHAIAVSSGTGGLHLTMLEAGIGPGDEVITSPFSFVASVNPIIFCGGKPIFSEIDPKTYNLDPAQIEKHITPRTKAILPVHIFGQSCDMDPIMEIAKKHNLIVIEDACESLLATYKGKNTGTFGKAAVFAFYPNKQMTTGEGGMIVTDDDRAADVYRSLRNQGRSMSNDWLEHDFIGYNYRMDDLSAGVGVAQLNKIERIISLRQAAAASYMQRLSKLDGVTLYHTDSQNTNTWFVYTVLVDDTINRDNVIKYLNSRGIGSKPYFPAMHLLNIYKQRFGYKEGDFPICESVSSSILALPFFTAITEEEIDHICKVLSDAILTNKK